METSAKTGLNIERAFMAVAKLVLLSVPNFLDSLVVGNRYCMCLRHITSCLNLPAVNNSWRRSNCWMSLEIIQYRLIDQMSFRIVTSVVENRCAINNQPCLTFASFYENFVRFWNLSCCVLLLRLPSEVWSRVKWMVSAMQSRMSTIISVRRRRKTAFVSVCEVNVFQLFIDFFCMLSTVVIVTS